MTPQELLALVISTNDARLDGLIDRAEHAVRIARIDAQLTENGLTWADLEGIHA